MGLKAAVLKSFKSNIRVFKEKQKWLYQEKFAPKKFAYIVVPEINWT